MLVARQADGTEQGATWFRDVSGALLWSASTSAAAPTSPPRLQGEGCSDETGPSAQSRARDLLERRQEDDDALRC
jgi:hypothetical protein